MVPLFLLTPTEMGIYYVLYLDKQFLHNNSLREKFGFWHIKRYNTDAVEP